MNILRKNILTAIVVLATLFCLGNDFNIDYLSGEQGLSQNEVTSILQDKNGFMWFGTRGGLNRYDGYEFIHHKSKANLENHLSNPSIESLLEDSKGNLWIGTKSGGLNFYDSQTETFTHITKFGNHEQALNDIRIISIAETLDGNIMVGTWSDGLYILDFKNNSIRYLLKGYQVNDILVDGEDLAWVAVNGGLFRLNLNTYSVTEIQLGGAHNLTKCISEPNSNLLWLSGWKSGVITLDKKSLKWKQFTLSTKTESLADEVNNTYSLLIDSNNRIWVGTWNGGVFLFDKENELFSKVDIKPLEVGDINSDYDIILAIYEDRDGNIWIGTDTGGIVRIGAKKSFGEVTLEKNRECGLENFHITCFWKSENGILYVGTRGGGLYKTADNKAFEKIPCTVKTGESSSIKSIFRVSDDILWIASATATYELDISKANNSLVPVRESPIADIRKITAVLFFGKNVLIGSQQSGLYFIRNYANTSSKTIHITPQNNEVLKNERINFIEQDHSGKIWIGTYKGIYFFDQQTGGISKVNVVNNEKFSSDIIHCWHQTNDSIFWVGTPSGLNKLSKTKSGKFRINQYYTEDGLPDDFIHGILSTTEDEIWMSTNSGLAKINIETGQILSFDKTDGLQGMIYSEDKGYQASDGTLYFGGNRGYNYFNQKDVSTNKIIPSVVFTNFKVYNRIVSPAQKVHGKVLFSHALNSNPQISLSYKEKEFTIEYAALNYNAPERNQYAYKLEGYDMDWILAGTKRSVTYTNMKPGKYVFKVRGSNNNYVWNMEGASLELHIKPAPWRTWYAFVIYVFFLIGIATLIRWNAVKQVRLSNSLEMEKLQHNQDQKMNEMKLRFFTNLSHEFRTPLTLILAPLKELLSRNDFFQLSEEARNKVAIVQNNSLRLMKLVNQLLDFRKVESGHMKLAASLTNINDFVAEVCHPFSELAEINNIQFQLILNNKDQNIWLDRDKVEIIINNLVSNAFKYISEKGKIEVELADKGAYICLCVSDNGTGIPEKEIDNIFERFYRVGSGDELGSSGIGLALAKRLVELHKGNISVESEPNIKTKFTISFQKGSSYLNTEERVEQNNEQATFVRNEEPTSHAFLTTPKPAKKSGDCILLVEDNLEVNAYLVSLLEPFYSVESAFDGQQGFEMAKAKNPKLIISDVMMPKMDGFEFCKNIKENESTSTTAFIFLTAKSDEQFKLFGTKLGADDFISKPFDPGLLLEKVRNILENRNKLQQQYSKVVRLEPSEIEITSQEEVFLEKVIALIEANFQNAKFTSDTLAAEMNMSRSTFYRKLKALTGSSVAEFIRSIRLKRAAQLLIDKQRTITEITYEVGFNDTKHFRTLFLKQFGCTPSGYRKKL